MKRMVHRTTVLCALACVGMVVAVNAPAASAAKPKLYSVSLSGEARNEATRVDDGVPPDGCLGTTSNTNRFVASAGLAPKANRAPMASHGRLRFPARLTSPSVVAGTETTGSFSPDPEYPPNDPSVCSAASRSRNWPCRPSPRATGRAGAEFALLPNKGRYELYYNHTDGIFPCDDYDLPLRVTLLDVAQTKLTKLRVRAVKRLAKGRSVSTSGTIVAAPLDPGATGGETLRYSLRVKRVR